MGVNGSAHYSEEPVRTCEMEPTRKGRRTCLAAVLSLLCVAVLLYWSATDASFPAATWVAKVNIGLERIVVADDSFSDVTDAVMSSVNQWDRLGNRVAALYSLYGIGLLTLGVLVVQVVRRRNFARVTACIVVVLAWSLFFFTRQSVDDWRCIRQLTPKLSAIEQAATALSQDWPQESGKIEPLGPYVVSPKHPNKLWLSLDVSYPIKENLDRDVTRSSDGVLRFSLAAASGANLEYHPHATIPTAYDSGFAHWRTEVTSVIALNDKWYLVRYTQALQEPER